jgi:mRNA-degrading endonuclease RelE of RelBE toxin-antitoxin system
MQTTSEAMVSRSILIGPAIWEELDSFDKNLKSKFVRAFRFLSRDISHPSLQIEYVKVGGNEFYRGRVDPKYRFHFERYETHYVILAIGPHRLQGIG